MREELKVPVKDLRRVCDPDGFNFGNTSEVEPVEGFIGQERAVQALKLGLEIDSPDYNITIIGNTGISRHSVLLRDMNKYVEERAVAEGVPSLRDFCCVLNFSKPNQPKILTFVQGEGEKLQKSINGILESLRKRIPDLLRSKEYLDAKDEIVKKLEEASKHNNELIQEELRKKGCILMPTLMGSEVSAASRSAGGGAKPMSEFEYRHLSDAERKALDETVANLNKFIGKVFQSDQESQAKTKQKIEELEKKMVCKLLGGMFISLSRKYAGHPEALSYFEGWKDYVSRNIHLFKEDCKIEPNGFSPFMPLKVNLLLDNSKTEKMPVIFESNPNFGNLFGRIEKMSVQGAYYTDHTYLKAGSMVLADGGYLVLNASDVLRSPGAWEKLEKTIRYGFLKIEEPMNYLGLVPNNLDPEQIPIKLKVILVCEPRLYQLLIQYDPEFSAIFRVKAELELEMPATQNNEMAYASFISLCGEEEDSRRKKDRLLPFDRSAVAKVIEYGHRLADSQTELSTEFNKIKELIIESDYWAEKAGSDKVKAEHVQKALEFQRLRANLAETRLHKFIKDEMLLLDAHGAKVGQINGLVVYDTGDYSFGIPSVITAQTFLGKKGVVSIDREVKMSGPIHDKGVHILSGYFGRKYGNEKPISFSASICFEQSYHGVEGDSASVAELVCLLSSLSELPINQYLAVTGSVNQKGQIQPIGGVNHKIEGFFNVCKERGLTGDQGVIIPHQNVKNLMLREDVVDACREGKFRVFAIKTIDEGLELLLNKSAEFIHEEVSRRLFKMTEKIQKAKGREE